MPRRKVERWGCVECGHDNSGKRFCCRKCGKGKPWKRSQVVEQRNMTLASTGASFASSQPAKSAQSGASTAAPSALHPKASSTQRGSRGRRQREVSPLQLKLPLSRC